MWLNIIQVFLLLATILIDVRKVTLNSRGNVFIPGDNPTYDCVPSSVTAKHNQWLINGTQLEDLNLTDVEPSFNPISRQGSLVFSNISMEYNNTNIRCRTTFDNGEIVDSSNVKLLVQGLLPAVGSLTATPILLDSIISLTWTPPFSLDITDVDPDITGYCVGVVNHASSLVIHFQCGITDTQYNYTVSPRSTPCDTYTFTITPVNIVGNGTSTSVTRLSNIYEAPQQVQNGDFKGGVMMNNSIFFYLKESGPVTVACSYTLDLYDIQNKSYTYIRENEPINQAGLRIQIPRNRDDGSTNLDKLFCGTVTLINSIGTTMSNINISTYDVQNITNNIQDEPVTVTIDYIENTEALGALLTLMDLDPDGNIVCSKSVYYVAKRRSEDDFPLPMGDPAMTKSYMGLAYDIERNGLEDKAYPAVRRRVDIGSSASSSNCTVTYVNRTASVSCMGSTSSGYQVILLQDNDPYNLIAVNVRPGEKQTVPVVPSGRYCIMELLIGDDIDSEVKYSRKFTAEENPKGEYIDSDDSEVKCSRAEDLTFPSSSVYKHFAMIIGTVVLIISIIIYGVIIKREIRDLPQPPPIGAIGGNVGITTILDPKDKADVLNALTDVHLRYKQIGTQLRINNLNTIRNTDGYTIAMGDVIEEWLKRNYNSEKFGPPTWKKLAEVVAHPNGGNNNYLAEKIKEEHPALNSHIKTINMTSIVILIVILVIVITPTGTLVSRPPSLTFW